MIKKIRSLEEAVTILQDLDAEIEPLLRSEQIHPDEQPTLVDLLKRRKTVISEMNRLKQAGNKVDEKLCDKLTKMHKRYEKTIGKLASKQGKILKRLKDRQKTVKNNKNFPY